VSHRYGTLQPDREITLIEALSILRPEWEKIHPPEQKRTWHQSNVQPPRIK